ncbi:hypothetical protein GJ744_007983 [Endocarpon pusillum]|uniref:Uncharacterized protein n=1 Tax=Endocarpon pusillum TaxID=364733 RepID=A0A8H7AQQ2_9EURO|nr:hypothetical protein GJ744_007983 [Endocarpon pusillum]
MNPVISAENLMQPIQQGRRSPKRQKTSKSVFNVWFGRIELISSNTEQEDDIDSHDIPLTPLQARRTSFRLIPNSWFLRFGLLFETGQSRPTISHPGWDNRLRVIRTHQENSSVYHAIYYADYVGFRQLLESREATPFDLVYYDGGSKSTLFEAVVQMVECCHLALEPSRETYVMRGELLKIAKLLADSGVDCGVGESLYWVIRTLRSRPNELSLSLFRIIMAQSQTDPFEEAGQEIVKARYSSLRLSILTKQDEWDLSEFTKLFEDHWGNGSFQFMIRQESQDWNIGEWDKMQKQDWCRMPIFLRRSRSHCAAVFGSRYVRYLWPELYWSDGKPAFWQSKQACEEFFGPGFVTYKWPELYWRAELPSLWSSKEACLEAFGKFFVHFYWPNLYWRQELPIFWHSRKACLEFFGDNFIRYCWPKYLGKTCFEFLEGKGAWGAWEQSRLGAGRRWDERKRNEWITQMIECWLDGDVSNRHTRQYCIDQYGVNFVKEELPSLLRRDGLPEEEVVRLTEDGPDMEPPPPLLDGVYEDSEYEESEDNQDQHDADSDAGSNGDSDDELSNGFQTADEDQRSMVQIRADYILLLELQLFLDVTRDGDESFQTTSKYDVSPTAHRNNNPRDSSDQLPIIKCCTVCTHPESLNVYLDRRS